MRNAEDLRRDRIIHMYRIAGAATVLLSGLGLTYLILAGYGLNVRLVAGLALLAGFRTLVWPTTAADRRLRRTGSEDSDHGRKNP
jgi:hypothetical protein